MNIGINNQPPHDEQTDKKKSYCETWLLKTGLTLHDFSSRCTIMYCETLWDSIGQDSKNQNESDSDSDSEKHLFRLYT